MTQPPDLGRRGFFRTFAKDVVQTAGTAIGTVAAVNRASLQAASGIFNPPSAAAPPGAEAGGNVEEADGTTAGNSPGAEAAGAADGSAWIALGAARAAPITPPGSARVRPFQVRDGVLVIVDENRLPDEVAEVECPSPVDLVREIVRMALPGGSVPGQAAAMSLALAAAEMRTYHSGIRTAILQVRAAALVNSRVSSQQLRWGVERLMRRYDTVARAAPETEEGGERTAHALRLEAEAIGVESVEAGRRIAETVVGLLPDANGRPVSILTHGSGAPIPAWTDDAPQALRELLVYVTEGRPTLRGARVTAADLASAGINHVLLADVAAGSLLSAGLVDAIVVGGERIAANGDTTGDLGTYPLAVLAAHHGVRFYVCAPLAAVDRDVADGAASPIEQRDAADVSVVRGSRIASPGTAVVNPACDITPASLITAIVTENGVLRPPFGPALAAALDPPG